MGAALVKDRPALEITMHHRLLCLTESRRRILCVTEQLTGHDMVISKEDAASALREIDSAADRSNDLRGYHIAGPILMVWGLVYLLGYGGMGALGPHRWGALWLPLDLLGVIATIAMLRRVKTTNAHRWRPLLLGLAITIFIEATYWVFRPLPRDGMMVFPGLVCGLAYMIAGTFRLTRFVWIGAAIFVATMIGFCFFRPWLSFWMAGVGGLGLLLGGFWMWKA
jgi:hypothetical protein